MRSGDPVAANWPRVVIHTDGGCQGNPGVGAWACVLQSGDRRREHSGGALATTNNRMELQAAIGALRLLKRPCQVTLYTDSDYLRQGITGWISGWKRNGWKTRDKMPVKNQDLWRDLDSLASVHRIDWKWLKGHAGHVENERCDVLAGAMMERLRREAGPERLRAALKEFEAGVVRDTAAPGLAPPAGLT